MSNAFESYADAAKPMFQRKREASLDKRRATIAARTEREKSLDEDEALLKRYKAIQREKLEALLAGPHGKEVRGLRSFLRTMTASSAPALVSFIQRARWITALPDDVRFIVHGIVIESIIRVRLGEGLEPFDLGGLWGGVPNASDLVAAIIRGPEHCVVNDAGKPCILADDCVCGRAA